MAHRRCVSRRTPIKGYQTAKFVLSNSQGWLFREGTWHHLAQFCSNSNVHMNQLRILWKCRFWFWKPGWEGEVRMCLGENETANVKRLVLSAETLAEVAQMQMFPYSAMWVTCAGEERSGKVWPRSPVSLLCRIIRTLFLPSGAA